MTMPYLSIITFLPLIGALIILLLVSSDTGQGVQNAR